MPATVRAATATDLQGVVACVEAAFETYIARIGKPPAPMLADYAALIAAGRVQVLTDAGGVVGVLVLEADPRRVFIDVLAVRAERQRCGFGRRLMGCAEAMARAKGLDRLELYTHERMIEPCHSTVGWVTSRSGAASRTAMRVCSCARPWAREDASPAPGRGRLRTGDQRPMTIIVTGSAGFIGFHVSQALLARGERVIGIDDLNAYYDPALKRTRLAQLQAHDRFTSARLDIADLEGLRALARRHQREITGVIHLAAQAGVRHSIEAPFDYVHANLEGHMVVLEVCRHDLPRLEHLVYASSSSVYGGNTKSPFAVEDRVDRPISLYAATKRANELMSHCYAHLYGIPQTGLRFFTVYGPWGRPDMAAWLFCEAIVQGRPITLNNQGDMERDFTYIDDITAGVVAALDRPPKADGGVPHALYNLGNHRPVHLRRFLGILEEALGRKAEIALAPLPPGDVVRTCADIAASRRDLGFEPKTPIEDGLPCFVAWYREYHGV